MKGVWLGALGALWLALGGSARAQDEALQSELREIQSAWAVVEYQTPEAEQEAAFAALAQRADAFTAAHPGRPEPLIWAAIAKSSWARVDAGVTALRLIGEARSALEEAERIDAHALDGSVYTSLGALYANVPGWPLSFGSRAKARAYLERALALNPTGIDANFFYGALLADAGEPTQAREHLQRALAAPDRPGQELADAGRRQEARDRLSQLPPAP